MGSQLKDLFHNVANNEEKLGYSCHKILPYEFIIIKINMHLYEKRFALVFLGCMDFVFEGFFFMEQLVYK